MTNAHDVSYNFSAVETERAIAEVRHGRPIWIRNGLQKSLYLSVENFEAELVNFLLSHCKNDAQLILSAKRLNALGIKSDLAASIPITLKDFIKIKSLALDSDMSYTGALEQAEQLDLAALELMQISLLAPAVLQLTSLTEHALWLEVQQSSLTHYRDLRAKDLHIVARAPVPLSQSKNSEFVVFRGGDGLRDQVAVVVGQPDLTQAVLVRLHSACLTGDLFGSLKCDCGDQLRRSVALMAEHGGGILLYLDQEGRGHGLANKMRAYQLQADGLDTIEADEELGFEFDQRRFDYAGAMLKILGATKIRLLTNNPEKLRALEKSGLVVVADERIYGKLTQENEQYLTTKRDKAGHLFEKNLQATN